MWRIIDSYCELAIINLNNNPFLLLISNVWLDRIFSVILYPIALFCVKNAYTMLYTNE